RKNPARAERLPFFGALDHFGSVVSPRARQHRNVLRLRLLDDDSHHAVLFFVAQRRAFSRSAARNQEIDARFDLPPHQPPQRFLIEREVAPERRHQRCTASRKHWSISFSTHSISLTISRKSKNPFFPATHRAARRAPRANPSRLRAVCRMVMLSAAESKP